MSNRKTGGGHPDGSEPAGTEETHQTPKRGSPEAPRPQEAAGEELHTGDAEQPDAAQPHAEASQPEAVEVSLASRIEALEAENRELKDQYLRKQAEFENVRKRMNRDKEEAIAFANKQLLLDLVTIIDDFERAIHSAEASRDFDSFYNGVVLIEKQFIGMLERKWGLKRFDSVGEPFDPQRHEALTTEEVADHAQSQVLEDYQKGYLLHDKVLRSAKVKVSLPGQG